MKRNTLSLNKYDALIILILACVLVTIICVWLWFGHKDAMIEHQIMQLKYTK